MRSHWVVCVFVTLTILGCGVEEPAEEVAVPVEQAAEETGARVVTSADGVEIAYTVHQAGEPALVLVHGWMCDQSYWQDQIPGLAGGFGVITVDLAGHGGSGLDRENWTIASLAGDVVAVVSELGLDEVIVVGHSMGGVVGLDVARQLPGAVIGVIGVDTLGNADAEWDQAQMDQLIAAFEADFENTCDGFVRSMFVEDTDAELVDTIVGDMCSGPADVGTGLFQALVGYDLEQGFRDAEVPIRSINADLWPTDLPGNREVADYDATILEGYGHFLMQEAPDQVTTAINATAQAIVAAEETSSEKHEVEPAA